MVSGHALCSMMADICPDGAPCDSEQSAKHCLEQLTELGYAVIPGILNSEDLEELRLVRGPLRWQQPWVRRAAVAVAVAAISLLLFTKPRSRCSGLYRIHATGGGHTV
jgi:hypothetical protein